MNVFPSDTLVTLAMAVSLVVLNASFVAAEFSLVKLRFTRIRNAEQERARKRERVARLLARMSPALNVVRFGVTTCTAALGFVVALLIRDIMDAQGQTGDSWILTVSMLGGFLLAVSVMFLVGELVPRALALQFPIASLRWSSWVVYVFRWISAPFLAVLNGFSSRLLGAFSIESSVDLNLVDVEAQIRSLMTSGEELPPIAEKLLHNVLDMRKRVAQDILLPRNQIVFLNLEESVEANLETARKAGHTRFPLCDLDLDHCIGLVHIKDIFRSREDPSTLDLRRHRREILRFSADEPVENVLQRMLKKRVHFALVVDEFGGAVGAVTLENVLEELVGDILDEFDKEEALIRPLEDGAYLVDGLAPLHDVCEELGVEIAKEDVSTFGGFITSSLGAMPVPGRPIKLGPLIVTVVNMNERRIISARVNIAPEEQEEDEENRRGAS